MRIAVFSDTHGNLSRLPAAQARLGRVDAVIHLGDHCRDAERIARAFGAPCLAVRGNCDIGAVAPLLRVAELGGARLLCVHGHLVPGPDALSYRAEQERCGAALFGHTHIQWIETRGGVLLVNPGSLSRPRGGSPCGCALLTIEQGEIRAQPIAL